MHSHEVLRADSTVEGVDPYIQPSTSEPNSDMFEAAPGARINVTYTELDSDDRRRDAGAVCKYTSENQNKEYRARTTYRERRAEYVCDGDGALARSVQPHYQGRCGCLGLYWSERECARKFGVG